MAWSKSNWGGLLLPALSGVLLGTSYTPFPPWAIFFAFLPLWSVWLKKDLSWKRLFFTGWITQFIFSFIANYWVAYTIHEYGRLPWMVAIVLFLGYCCIGFLFIPVTGLCYFLINRFCQKYKMAFSVPQKVFVLALLAGTLEEFFPCVFPSTFSYALFSSRIPAYHLADIFGFFTLHTLFLLLSALLFLIIVQWRQSQNASNTSDTANASNASNAIQMQQMYPHGA